MTTPNVAYIRPEVEEMLPQWDLIRDAIAGEVAVKAKTDTYLPRPNAADRSEENQARYDSYILRANFYNVTGRTHQGLVGQCFQKDPVLELPSNLKILEKDIDGSGVTLLQQAKRAVGNVLDYGRSGLLADYPSVGERAASIADLRAGLIRPTVVLYDPWDIINWRTTAVGGNQLLTRVVLKEGFNAKDDGFELTRGIQWRELRLEPMSEGGRTTFRYRVTVWRRNDTENQSLGPFIKVSEVYPRNSSNGFMDRIPFLFLGAVKNNDEIDPPPMYDLASVNMSHYRTSADHEEAVYLTGNPQPTMNGLTQTWVDANFKGGVRFGSRTILPLPQGGELKLVSAPPNTLTGEALKEKERRMVALGARLVEERSVQRTLGEKKLEFATEISILGSCANNVAAGYVKALESCSQFVGAGGAPVFELYPEFELDKMTPQERQQLMAEWQSGALTWEEYRTGLQKAGVAYEDAESAREIIASEKPRGGVGVLGAQLLSPNPNVGAPNAAGGNAIASQ